MDPAVPHLANYSSHWTQTPRKLSGASVIWVLEDCSNLCEEILQTVKPFVEK